MIKQNIKSAILAWLACSGLAFAHADYASNMSQAPMQPAAFRKEGLSNFRIDERQQKHTIEDFCKRLGIRFKDFAWDQQPCGSVNWQTSLQTVKKFPLVYASFGKGHETTLLLSGVHPNEVTPVPMGFRLAKHLQDHPELVKPGQRVVIAPLINPDGLFIEKLARTNARGVDPNRNFFTMDWYAKSLTWWQNGKKKKPDYFPGYFPNSEIETIFQVGLIDEFQPDKILSIHAPLGFLDYDGPGDQKPHTLNATESQAKSLVATVAKKSKNYRVVDYSFYPGSLGNFAGNERHIPTVTIELKTTDASKVEEYWKQFLPGMLEAISFPFKRDTGSKLATFKFYSHYGPLHQEPKDPT